jgi:hypothetical protein
MIRSVDSAFSELLKRESLTQIQSSTAATRVFGLRNFFNSQFSMVEDPFSVGSFARLTICAGERDIDMMAPFDAYGVSPLWERFGNNSRDFLYWVRNTLNERYATTQVSSKQVAVSLDFTTIKVDVVPCFQREGGGYLMPNGSGGWQATDPKFHTELINRADSLQLWNLKPVIKLAKIWNNANGRHLRSFHVELMVESMWRDVAIQALPYAMKETLRVLPYKVRSNFADPWNTSAYVDQYLSRDDRALVIRMLNEDAENAKQAEEFIAAGNPDKAFERWDIVFRHKFPARYY